MNEPLDADSRIVSWCGIVAIVMIVAGFFAVDAGGSTPADGRLLTLAREITEDRGRIVVGSLMGMVGAMLLVVFTAGLRVRLASDDRNGAMGTMLGLVAYAFGVIMTVGAFTHGSLRVAATAIDDPGVLAGGMRALTLVIGVGAALMLWGAIGLVATLSAGSFLGGSFLPRALAWIGAVLVIASVALTPTDRGGVGLMLLPWIAISGVRILNSAPTDTRPAR